MAIKSDKFINIGKYTLKFIWLVFMATTLNNVVRQIKVVMGAREENRQIEENIAKLETDNIELEQNIRYATSSAYLAAVARDEFGLGDIGDYWIEAPDMEIGRQEVIRKETDKSNWNLWLDLFTN